jgi:hypothetical protein
MSEPTAAGAANCGSHHGGSCDLVASHVSELFHTLHHATLRFAQVVSGMRGDHQVYDITFDARNQHRNTVRQESPDVIVLINATKHHHTVSNLRTILVLDSTEIGKLIALSSPRLRF